MHELFDDVAVDALEWVDLIAECATALGGEEKGTVRLAAAVSRLPELPGTITEGMRCVAALVARMGAHAASTRSAIS